MTNPSLFLSYSHDSTAPKAWVRKLAEDLRHGGVDATLEQWDLKAGADLVAFMAGGDSQHQAGVAGVHQHRSVQGGAA